MRLETGDTFTLNLECGINVSTPGKVIEFDEEDLKQALEFLFRSYVIAHSFTGKVKNGKKVEK